MSFLLLVIFLAIFHSDVCERRSINLLMSSTSLIAKFLCGSISGMKNIFTKMCHLFCFKTALINQLLGDFNFSFQQVLA